MEGKNAGKSSASQQAGSFELPIVNPDDKKIEFKPIPGDEPASQQK